jgi:general L-amino acid transport system permease protein
VHALRWTYANLFSSPLNAVLTLVALWILWIAVPPFLDWAVLHADFTGATRTACDSGGACWVFVKEKLPQFLYGLYPVAERWRVDLAFALLVAVAAPLFIPRAPRKLWIGAFVLFVYPLIAYALFAGGWFALREVETGYWGGLMLTLIVAGVGMAGSLPIGVLFALGRRSEMPAVRYISIGFIELMRGVPLITVLFMASVMLPLFLPAGVNFNKLLRALIGVMLFDGAYMAEVVRGGLQAIPKGQTEAAAALGLGYWRSMGLVVLPQALRMVIPGIVNSFIALFKDTTLVLIIGLFDFLGAIQAALSDPNWLGYAIEGYVFAAAVYWVFCFAMSRYSLSIERRLAAGGRR